LEQTEDLEEPFYSTARAKIVPIVEALDSECATNLLHAHCEASGFCAIHSCINHSCDPNIESIKSVEDIDGDVTLYALRKIEAGEELLLNYIDVESKSVEQRRAQLSAYGFTCQCHRCQVEAQDAEQVASEGRKVSEQAMSEGRGSKRKAAAASAGI
jgi:hypothetical protein